MKLKILHHLSMFQFRAYPQQDSSDKFLTGLIVKPTNSIS